MEMREPCAHNIGREAAACLTEIDEIIPVLLETVAPREVADIGRTLAPFSRRAAEISRRGCSGTTSPPAYRHLAFGRRWTKRCRVLRRLGATGLD
jgi:hypothetical protein